MTQVNSNNIHTQHLSNINRFLSAFKFSSDSSVLSPSFTEDPLAFSKECLIPDIYTKTKIPFNKNSLFDIKGGIKVKRNPKMKNIKPNLFPRHPLIVDESSELRKEENNRSKKRTFFSNNSMFSNIEEKCWIVTLINGNKTNEYGPMNSMNVYLFIKNVYMKMSKEEKENNTLMIMDVELNIHYHPETLMEYFTQAFKEKQDPI